MFSFRVSKTQSPALQPIHPNQSVAAVSYTHLRVSELCNLKLSELYFDEGFIKVEGKGSKQRFQDGSVTLSFLFAHVYSGDNSIYFFDGKHFG